MLYNLQDTDIPKEYRILHVKSGYRWHGNYKDCMISLFKWHNEILNIWSMIAMNITSFMLLLNLVNFLPLDPTPFYLLYISSFIHLPFSVGYHLFLPIEKVNEQWYKLDLSFIFISVSLIVFAMSYYVLPTIYILFLLTIVSIFSLTCIYNITISPRCCKKGTNAKYVSIITSFMFVPIVYQICIEYPNHYEILGISSCILFSLICGVISYTNPLIQKKLNMSSMDIAHTVMHVMVLVAHIFEYIFILHVLQYNTIQHRSFQ